VKRVYSAGGVVFKFEGEELKILLILTQNGKVWGFPKGIIEKDEDPKETALREIKEETGVSGKIIDEVGETSYCFVMDNEKNFKKVKYFLIEYTGGELNPEWEVDAVEWFTPHEALQKLTYENDREILKKSVMKISE
jgi:8-oxo-dGTP diphosphatase